MLCILDRASLSVSLIKLVDTLDTLAKIITESEGSLAYRDHHGAFCVEYN